MRYFCLSILWLALSIGPECYSQSVSYYDLTIESDSVSSPFVSPSANYAFVRSKRGVDGVNQTPEADAIRQAPIQKIVLVFSEDSPEDLENREEYNMERWDNLILTYPEFFQEKTKYRNICQCSAEAGGETFKQAQGFYIYYKTAEKPPVSETKKPETPRQEPVNEVKKKDEPKVDAPAVAIPAAAVAVEAAKPSAPEPKTEAAKEPAQKTKEAAVLDEEPEVVEKPAKAAAAKKPASNKPRRAKDPKACRAAFYGSGDEDLYAYFRDNITLSKKEKKKAKKWEAELRIQLNLDGSVKRVMVVGTETEFNKTLEGLVKNMNNWNAAVRNGVTIRSEVRMKIKFDKDCKCFKPFEVINNPKPAPKCKQQSDEELFGS